MQKLYRFREMPNKIKIHLIKTLILPLLDYPPIPIHTLSKTQIRKFQKTQNKALRLATDLRYPYTMNTREIHEHTNTLPMYIRLHLRAVKTWEKLELFDNHHLSSLKENQKNIIKYNKWFPSSLINIDREPEPIFN